MLVTSAFSGGSGVQGRVILGNLKKHIGYVSPEMHRAYLKNLPAIEIVASGLHDSIGLYKRPQPEQMAICEWWMDIFGIAELKDKPFFATFQWRTTAVIAGTCFCEGPGAADSG